MQIITEEIVRQMVYKQQMTEITVEPDAYISKEAAQYIREKGLHLVLTDTMDRRSGEPETNRDIQPIVQRGGKPNFTNACTGEVYNEKPEYMTHLYGTVLVAKNHPRIILRGKLDSLEAELVLEMVRASAQGREQLVQDLGELLDLARRILSAEVSEKPLNEERLLGLDDGALRAQSHNPQKQFGRGHLLPSANLSHTGAMLNVFRTRVREVELAAMDAFWQNGTMLRGDLIKALNRMSSACYIMMFYDLKGRYDS